MGKFRLTGAFLQLILNRQSPNHNESQSHRQLLIDLRKLYYLGQRIVKETKQKKSNILCGTFFRLIDKTSSNNFPLKYN